MKVLGVLSLAGVFLAGCRPSSDPKEVAAAFWEAVKRSDLSTAKGLMTRTDREIAPDVATQPIREAQASFRFGAVSYDGASSRVATTLQSDGQEHTFDTVLAKEDGLWKVRARRSVMNLVRRAINKSADPLGLKTRG